MTIYRSKDGRPCPFPDNPDDAKRAGLYKWYDFSGCTGCGSAETVRYVEGNQCVGCLRAELSKTPDLPNKVEAIERGLDYWYLHPGDLCDLGPHLFKRRLKAQRGVNKCITCTEHKSAYKQKPEDVEIMEQCPDLVIPFKTAKAMGLKVYRTGKTCKRGHKSWRYVSTGGCIECKREGNGSD